VSIKRWLAGLGAMATVAGLTIVSFGGSAGASPTPQFARLAGSVAPFTQNSRELGAVSAATRLSIQVWLTPKTAAAQRYATAVSTPGDAMFHHYLSPDAYTARFGATKAQAAKVESWLRGEGFTDVHADSQRDYVRATGSATTIDAAFKVQLENYRASAEVNAGRYSLRANNRPITLPAALVSSVLGVTGLDNAAPELPLEYPTAKPHSPGEAKLAKEGVLGRNVPCSFYYGEQYAKHLPKHFGVRNFPQVICGYDARQLRAAYGANFKNTGRGQTIALIELGLTPDMFQTLQDYARDNHMPAPSSSRYSELSLGRGTQCGDEFDIEEQLDVEASYDMAPGASQLVVGGDSCNNGDNGLQGLFNADLAVLNGAGHHPLATIASNSWEGNEEEQAPLDTNIENSYLLRAAAEGVGMYFSAGDGSGVLSPSDNPNAIAVGGTTLGIGLHHQRLFETGWSTGESFLTLHRGWVFAGEQGATGGGPSLLWAQPAYQAGVVPTALATAQGNRGGLVRSAPDISADADPFTGIKIGILTFPENPLKPPVYMQFDVGGTSESSPLVAGMVAAAQQGQRRAFGFIDPVLYRLGPDALYHPQPITTHTPVAYRGVACDAQQCGIEILTTFDDQNTYMFGYTGQVTLPGYNNMTGVGTPHGQIFIDRLRALDG
jgi:subtilase family serine protease